MPCSTLRATTVALNLVMAQASQSALVQRHLRASLGSSIEFEASVYSSVGGSARRYLRSLQESVSSSFGLTVQLVNSNNEAEAEAGPDGGGLAIILILAVVVLVILLCCCLAFAIVTVRRRRKTEIEEKNTLVMQYPYLDRPHGSDGYPCEKPLPSID